ncbi:MAG: hypothetical protein M1546_25320 [Chloroflexi bacterium]|nr:hypothetical protein [Chloroflexota bacterium]
MTFNLQNDWRGWVSPLLVTVGLLLTACGGGSTPASVQTATPTATGPQLRLSPASGTLNTQLTIDGAGFPANAQVRVHMDATDTDRSPQFIGEVLTNEGGQFKLIFIIPSVWSDGTPITDRTLNFTGITADEALSATAGFTNVSAPSGEGMPQPEATDPADDPSVAGPSLALVPDTGGANTTVAASASGFPANTRIVIQLGVPGAGANPQVYANVETDANGSASLSFVMPGAWPDGRAITDRTLIVLAGTEDGRIKALAQFNFDATAPAATPVATVSDGSAQPTTDVVATPTAGAQTTVPASTTPLVVDGPGPDTPEPIQASIDFLYSLLRDPSGASSVSYLSQRLRTEISDNWALPTGLGIQPGYNSFQVVMVGKSEESVTLQATLTYESGASIRTLTMVKEGENWRVDKVVAGGQ